MKNKIKKIVLIVLVLVIMVFAGANIALFSDAGCGCADSYMGASFVRSLCTFVGGEMIFRRCVYVY